MEAPPRKIPAEGSLRDTAAADPATPNEVGSGGTSGVESFNGRSGTVTSANGDYTSAQVTHGAGTVSAALAASLQKAGGDMTGTLGLHGTGGNRFSNGTGDGASYATHNFKLRGHWGLGLETYDGTVNGVYDFRSGSWDVKGGYKVNGVSVLIENDVINGGTF